MHWGSVSKLVTMEGVVLDIHVASQKLDLQRHDSFANPHHGEDAGEHKVLLRVLCST